MDTIDTKAAISLITTKFRTVASSGMNPNFSWSVVVTLTILAGVVTGGFALFTYQWTVNPQGSGAKVSVPQKSVSAADINSVIKIYEEKQKQYEGLLQNRPHAPNPKAGSGVDVNISEVSGSEILDVDTSALSPNPIGDFAP
ncbi:MAG: hypothetical protein UY04_C0003G0022 [Parcubacteria group bacterium GW2011_GWA2_47_7]|nr:MAG: hypothetical protein UY04_C0003G0022 [Parcubacteria group bacterium GW2011_GWA2_47_7]